MATGSFHWAALSHLWPCTRMNSPQHSLALRPMLSLECDKSELKKLLKHFGCLSWCWHLLENKVFLWPSLPFSSFASFFFIWFVIKQRCIKNSSAKTARLPKQRQLLHTWWLWEPWNLSNCKCSLGINSDITAKELGLFPGSSLLRNELALCAKPHGF